MAARSSPGGFVVATVTNPGSFMATITHPTGNGYCRDRILRVRPLIADDVIHYRCADGRDRPKSCDNDT